MRALATLDPSLDLALDELDSLKPYTSLQVVRCPPKDLDGLVKEILDALPTLLDEILVGRLLGDMEELLRDRRPPWLRPAADLLGWEGAEVPETAELLEALEARLSRPPGPPVVSLATGKPLPGEPDLATRICDLAGLEAPAYRRRTLMTVRPSDSDDDVLEVGALWYVEQRLPGWRVHDWTGPVDRLHQLVLVCRCRAAGKAGCYLAFYASEPAAKQKIARAIGAKKAAPPFSALARIDRRVLDAAFVERDRPVGDLEAQRRIRTLWLSGIHRSAAWKPDGKVLMGPDLENALEPLGDQTYYFTAARCRVPVARNGQALTVGVAPRRSSLWAGPVPSWDAFRERVVQLLEHIAASPRAKRPPLAVLAAQVRVGRKAEVAGAYDLSVICPELLAEEPNLNPTLQEQAELWAYHARFFEFEAKDAKGPAFTVHVAVEGVYVGALEIDFGEEWTPKVKCLPYDLPAPAVLARESVEPMVPDGNGEESGLLESQRHRLHVEAASVCRRPRWLTVRYDSGHTLSAGQLFSVRHRDVSFDSWAWAELSKRGFNVWQEKPMIDKETGEPVLDRPKPKSGVKTVFDPARIGEDRSLFCWVQQNWPIHTPGVPIGWLACDDGAGEIADFIHLDPNPPDGRRPLLSLIHVKGSHSDSKKRQISVSDYEVVVGQAVKNLRYLDRINLADSLSAGAGKVVGKAVWKDGRPTEREKMVEALRDLKDGYRRQVVVVQPRVTSTSRRAVRNDRTKGRETKIVQRMRQLDTLLVAAQADCRALQADLLVVGESLG